MSLHFRKLSIISKRIIKLVFQPSDNPPYSRQEVTHVTQKQSTAGAGAVRSVARHKNDQEDLLTGAGNFVSGVPVLVVPPARRKPEPQAIQAVGFPFALHSTGTWKCTVMWPASALVRQV